MKATALGEIFARVITWQLNISAQPWIFLLMRKIMFL